MTARRCTTLLVPIAVMAAVALGWLVRTAIACSVPVFRYALERWEAEPFRVVVFHRGDPGQDVSSFIKTLSQAAANETSRANVQPLAVNVDKPIPEESRDIWALTKTENLPRAVALFTGNGPPAWSGKPTLENAKNLLDSPARSKVADYIMKGASAVWVLLESGDPRKDDRARKLLADTLSKAEKTLDLPEILPEDRERNMSADGPELKIWLPMVSLSRSDPKEAIFVEMLGRTEENMPANEPVAFPIFGRGRLLGTFHGEMLSAREIEAACAFLTGMCSCQAKEMNPGTDLLFTAGWHRFLGDGYADMAALPALVGTPQPASADAGTQPKPETAREGTTPAEEPAPSGEPIFLNLLIALGLGVLGVLAVSLILWRRRKAVS